MRPRLAAVLAPTVMIAVALTGCASAGSPAAGSTATVTTTATATVTAAPEPSTAPRSPEDALTDLDAWLLCWGATYGEYKDSSVLFPYTPGSASGGDTVTDNGDGTFTVLVPFAPTSGSGAGAEAICIAGGTVGEPTLDLQGGRDFG